MTFRGVSKIRAAGHATAKIDSAKEWERGRRPNIFAWGAVAGPELEGLNLELLIRQAAVEPRRFAGVAPPQGHGGFPMQKSAVVDAAGHILEPPDTWDRYLERKYRDRESAAAYCRAYNNYLFDFCSRHSDRLIAVAHINLCDVNLAVAEVQRVKGKAKGIFCTPYPMNGRPYGHRYYDPFWAACEAADLPVSTHVQVRPNSLGHEFYPAGRAPWFFFMELTEDSIMGMNLIFQGGVPERFPRLKYVVLETGCVWLPSWMERAGSKY